MKSEIYELKGKVQAIVYPCLMTYISNDYHHDQKLVVLKTSDNEGTVMYAPDGSNHTVGDHAGYWCDDGWELFGDELVMVND